MALDRDGNAIVVGNDYVLVGEVVQEVGNRVVLDLKRLREIDAAGSGTPTVAVDSTDLIPRGASASHTHAQADVTNLTTDLAGKQPLDALLTAIAALVTAADKIAYFTGVDAVALADFTEAARTFCAALDAGEQRSALGLGSLATKNTVATSDIDNDAVTYAKLQNVTATDRVLGRSTAGAGDVQEITCTAAGRALIDDADNTAQRATLGLGSAATHNVGAGGSDLVTLGVLVTAFQPLDGDLSTFAGLSPSDGSILFRSSGAWTALAPGGEGQVLKINGSLEPEWQDP